MKIAAVILAPKEGDPVSKEQLWADKSVSPLEATIARMDDLTRTAASHGAKIVSFQEFALTINARMKKASEKSTAESPKRMTAI